MMVNEIEEGELTGRLDLDDYLILVPSSSSQMLVQ